MLKRFAAAAALTVFAAGPAFAVSLTESTPVNATPDKVWAAVGDFCGIAQWHPAVEGCTLVESGPKPVRRLQLKGGGEIVEEQTGRDEAAMTYSYTILESPLPVSNYISTLKVEPSGSSGSKITWTGDFQAKGASDDEAKTVIDGIYVKGLAGIVDKATRNP